MDPFTLPEVAERLRRIDDDRIVARIWDRDHTVWKEDPAEISNRLGWLSVAGAMRERVDELEAFAERAAADGLETAVLLGMGGSSLAPEVLGTTFGSAAGRLELIVLDTTHPATVRRLTDELDLRTTVFLVASKSGTTTETLSHFHHFWELVGDGSRFVAITDAGTPLDALGTEREFRAVFRNPDDIGGRYSALSLFGLVPGALVGAPLHELLDHAEAMAAASGPTIPAVENPAAALGAVAGELALAGRDKLTIVLPPEISSLGDWIEQLIAESTGKEGTGIVPVVAEELGEADRYGDDRLFVAIGEAAGLDRVEPQAVVRLEHQGLGAEFFRWELATALAGWALRINPFDQPNVQEAKDATKEILAGGPGDDPGFDDPMATLKEVGPRDYVAILSYLDRTSETEDAVQELRMRIRDRYRVATTVGFGPRYLHSTGQLHKGGPSEGVFLQLVDPIRDVDVAVPGSEFSFGTLIDAQALGDLRSLRARGRRVARVTMERLAEVI
jgi:glucose-6-phosphate isomerase